jgi:hypothetical protein
MSEMVADDIDMFRVPRVMPEGTVVIDAFPLSPIPERLDPVRADLLGELALAHAPFSGRRIACILAGENEGYGGHVIEHSPTNIEDPFMMALRKVPEGVDLYGIMVTGEGLMKEKHVLPSGAAYDAIAPRLLPGSPIVMMPPNRTDVCRFIPESRHATAYSPKPISIFEGKTVVEIYSEAIRSTCLSMEDCMFVAHLRLAGLKQGIHYFLTGSGNGLSGPSVAIRPGMYSDLDIIAISDRDAAEVEAEFEGLAEACYGVLDKVPKLVNVAGSDRQVEGCIYSNLDSGISIDFFASKKLEDAFVRSESLERNYFHQLS